MSKPMPAHHQEVAIARKQIANGYGGTFTLPQAGPGLWMIVAACPPEKPDEHTAGLSGFVLVIVAPARVPK